MPINQLPAQTLSDVFYVSSLARYASESVGGGDDARDETGNNSFGHRVSGATINLEWDSDMSFSHMQGLSQSRSLVLEAVGAAPSVSLEANEVVVTLAQQVVDDSLGRSATSKPGCERAARATRNTTPSEKPGARQLRSKDVASVKSQEQALAQLSTPRHEMLPPASVDR
jgi:hypothetical protein